MSETGAIRLAEAAATGAVEIGAGAPAGLPAGPFLWRVEGGPAEVYLDDAAGRRLIALAPQGGCVAAMPRGAEGALTAVGEPGTRLTPIERLGPEEADAWVLAVAEALDPPAPEQAPAVMEPGAQGPERVWIRAPRGRVVWLIAATPVYCGAAKPAPAQAIPLTGALTGLSAEGPAGVADAATLHGEGRLGAALAAFTAGLPGYLAALRRAADDRALTALTGAATGGAAEGAGAAVTEIAKALGVDLRAPLPVGSGGYADAPALLRRAGLRARKIALGPGWSRRDAGPIIAEQGEARAAAALIWRKGAYRDAAGAPVRDEEAFGPFALAVHAPLPDKVKGLFSLAWHLAPALKRDGGLAIAAGAGASAIGVLTPLAAGWIFSDIVPASLGVLLLAVGLALFAGAVVSTLFAAAKSLALQRIAGRTGLDTAAAVADKVLRLPPGWFREYSAGDLNQRIAAIDQLRQLVTGVMLSAGLTLIFSIFYFVTLLAFDAALAGLAFVLVLIYVAATFLARALQMRHVRLAAELDGKVSGASYETLAAIGKLRVAAAEERALGRWLKLYGEERKAGVAMGRIGVHFGAFADAYQTVTLMALFGVAAVLTAQDVPAGLFIGFLVAFGSFQGAFTGFCDGLMSLFTAAPLAERAKPIFASEAETTEDRGDPGRLTGAIELAGVAFSYPGGRPLLDGLDLAIKPGEHIAIVGGSGSGKSTVLRLLLGFESPDRGTISYDGRDLARLDLGRVRSQIGVVMQASRLFAGSIFENIRGATDAGLEECMAAAEAAGLAPDLAGFPMGLHTPITEGAGALSGGQRQRILIARALVGKPAIQFLDEATSALDNATQAVVMRALERSPATRIVIAHRLSTVRKADRICVLKDGRFAEIGTYEELMEQDGDFAALAKRQLLES